MIYTLDKRSKSWSGEAVGILVLDCAYPYIPGNVANANTYPFPVRYHEVKGADTQRMVYQADKSLVSAFVEGAKQLEREGVRAITGACGFMALFQKEVADAVDVPVFLSSLLQIPFIVQTLSSRQKLGVITANKSKLTTSHFRSVGVTEDMPVVVYGMENKPEFLEAILHCRGTLDNELMQKEIIEVVDEMIEREGTIGAILLECSDLPPYAKLLHDHTGLPIYDFITMIKHVYNAVTPKQYEGHL